MHKPPLAEVNKAIDVFNVYASTPMQRLQQDDLSLMKAGKVYHHMSIVEGKPITTLGCMLTDARLEDLWLVTNDKHFQIDGHTVRSIGTTKRRHALVFSYRCPLALQG